VRPVLLHLDVDPKPSAFDLITACDAGAEVVLPYGGVTPGEVGALVYGALFTRKVSHLRHTAIFVGGSKVDEAEEVMEQVLKTFFGPFRVSVMFDANGCNTTAAAAVRKMASALKLEGRRVLVLAGTGPVGLRAAALLAREGARVRLSSRSPDRAQSAAEKLREQRGLEVEPICVTGGEDLEAALNGAEAVLACGAAGVRLMPGETWVSRPELKVLADVNAVEPLGIEGIKATDDGEEREGKIVFGALAIGGLKMRIHHTALGRLFEANDQVFDLEEIYELSGHL